MTNLLLDKLKSSPAARIVNVASNAHHRAAFEIGDLNWELRPYSGIRAYGANKFANILFTRELARRLDGTQVTANCLHPGVVATNFAGNGGWLWQGVLQLARPFMRTPEEGAAFADNPDDLGLVGDEWDDAEQLCIEEADAE